MIFRLVPKSVTLNDLDRRNGPYFALFHRIRIRCRRKTITSISKLLLIGVTVNSSYTQSVAVDRLVSWSLTSLFSTNMAISETSE